MQNERVNVYRPSWSGKRLHGVRMGVSFPWGDEFDKEKCNSAEAGFKHTTPVTQYPKGGSPYGCYDMAGNVWE